MDKTLFLNNSEHSDIAEFTATVHLYRHGFIPKVQRNPSLIINKYSEELRFIPNTFEWIPENKSFFIEYYKRNNSHVDILSRMYDKICEYSKITNSPGGIMQDEHLRKLFKDDDLEILPNHEIRIILKEVSEYEQTVKLDLSIEYLHEILQHNRQYIVPTCHEILSFYVSYFKQIPNINDFHVKDLAINMTLDLVFAKHKIKLLGNTLVSNMKFEKNKIVSLPGVQSIIDGKREFVFNLEYLLFCDWDEINGLYLDGKRIVNLAEYKDEFKILVYKHRFEKLIECFKTIVSEILEKNK